MNKWSGKKLQVKNKTKRPPSGLKPVNTSVWFHHAAYSAMDCMAAAGSWWHSCSLLYLQL